MNALTGNIIESKIETPIEEAKEKIGDLIEKKNEERENAERKEEKEEKE